MIMKKNNYNLSLYEKAMPDNLTLLEKIHKSIELGFDSCEICIDLNKERQKRVKWSGKKRKEILNYCDQHEIQIPTLSLSAVRQFPLGLLDDEKNSEALQLIEEALIFCQNLSIKTMLLNAYDVYYEDSTVATQKRFGENLYRVTELAEKYKITIGLENAEKKFADNAEKVDFWVKKANSPYIKIYYDPANAYNAFEGDFAKVKQDFLNTKSSIVASHLKDSMPGEYRMTPYGEGQVDFSKVSTMLRKNNIKQFTAELFLRSDRNWEEYASWVNKFLRGYLK